MGFPQFDGRPDLTSDGLPQLPPPTEDSAVSQTDVMAPTYTTPTYEMPTTSNTSSTSDVFQLPSYRVATNDPGTNIQLTTHQSGTGSLQPPIIDGYPSLPGETVIPTHPPAAGNPLIPGAIGSEIAAPTSEPPPLQEQTIAWYEYPWRWLQGWDNHAEFGIDGSNGNAETLAMQAGLEMKRKTDDYTLALDIDYRLANTRNRATNLREVTEDSGRLNLDYDRLLGDSPWSAFGKFGLEFDEFKAFDLRVNINGGVGYHWIRNDRTTLVTRFGAGASREFGAPVDRWTPEGVFGFEADHQLNNYNKLKAKIDYFPSWEDFDDFRLVTDLGWEILLNEAENLSLKLALTDRYDSTPQGAKPNDVYYSLLFLVKF